MKTLIALISTLILFTGTPAFAEDHGHDEEAHAHKTHNEAGHDDHKEDGHKHEKSGAHEGHEGEGGAIKLSPAQVKQAGIETDIIRLQSKSKVVSAPGNVAFNGYKLADVTTLVDSVIHARHVRLGDEVKKGQRLATLTSSELAKSQADYLRSEADHRKAKLDLERIEGLAKEKIVSQARLLQATSIHQSAHANLAAARATLASYGLSSSKIDMLMNEKRHGRLIIYAPVSGTVVADDFRIGQHIAAGTRLLQIADESTVWVEVKLPQSQAGGIYAGRIAVVTSKDHKGTYKAKVINIHHQLDKATRTVGVRLEVRNSGDALHPGMFVDAEIKAGNGEEALLMPKAAIQRQGSELIVFVEEEPGHFERREVRVGKSSMGVVPVLEGLKEGESVVIKGAFALASESAKSGFEVHNH